MSTIAEIIENKLGFHNDEEFAEFHKQKRQDGVTLEEVALLSPDNIDNGEFWAYIDKTFKKSVCGSGGQNIHHVNHLNLRLAHQIGALGYLLPWVEESTYEYPLNLVEIGPGYGSILNYIRGRGYINYLGFDVAPKMPDIFKVDNSGISPEDLEEFAGKAHVVYSFNVFQHLSELQRQLYYKQAYQLLTPNRYFIVTQHIVLPHLKNQYIYCKENDTYYICHYGQYTPLYDFNHYVNTIEEKGFILCQYNCRYDGMYCFIFGKKSNEINEPSNSSSDSSKTA